MARVILVTGGCRSGKSAYAQGLGESLAGERVYIATCPVIDEEMRRGSTSTALAPRSGKRWKKRWTCRERFVAPPPARSCWSIA